MMIKVLTVFAALLLIIATILVSVTIHQSNEIKALKQQNKGLLEQVKQAEKERSAAKEAVAQFMEEKRKQEEEVKPLIKQILDSAGDVDDVIAPVLQDTLKALKDLNS